ncbi:hypothetical protein P8452_20703 [Trifolium repens]|nr:hypothetical protein P8452_20703 [Trifolium repens]
MLFIVYRTLKYQYNQEETKRGVSGERLSTVDLAVEPYSAHLGKLKGLPVATRLVFTRIVTCWQFQTSSWHQTVDVCNRTYQNQPHLLIWLVISFDKFIALALSLMQWWFIYKCCGVASVITYQSMCVNDDRRA